MSQNINDNFKINAGKSVDAKYGKTIAGKTVSYASTSEANTAINVAYRYMGLTVLISDESGATEYWYTGDLSDGSLVSKSAASVNASNGLTFDGNNIKLGGVINGPDATVIDNSAASFSIYPTTTPASNDYLVLSKGSDAELGFNGNSNNLSSINVSDGRIDIYINNTHPFTITDNFLQIAAIANVDETKFMQADAGGNIYHQPISRITNDLTATGVNIFGEDASDFGIYAKNRIMIFSISADSRFIYLRNDAGEYGADGGAAQITGSAAGGTIFFGNNSVYRDAAHAYLQLGLNIDDDGNSFDNYIELSGGQTLINKPVTISQGITISNSIAETASLKIGAGTLLTTPDDGAIEYDGTHLYSTIGSDRFRLDQQNIGDGTLIFGNYVSGTPENYMVLTSNQVISLKPLDAQAGTIVTVVAVDPTTSDVAEGTYKPYRNISTSETRLWTNESGTMKSILFT